MVSNHYFKLSNGDKYDNIAKREINKELGFHNCNEFGSTNLETKNYNGVNG